MSAPWPRRLRFSKSKAALALELEDGRVLSIPYELLRVQSPSAEVQGHAPDQRKLVPGKAGVGVKAADPVGHYAVRIAFDDGHDTGLFTWDYLVGLGETAQTQLEAYRAELAAAGLNHIA
ncbi:MAG: gamma-butyrobetaine hydroxylase-like domain-containing protein [Maricaulaceae bacterium]